MGVGGKEFQAATLLGVPLAPFSSTGLVWNSNVEWLHAQGWKLRLTRESISCRIVHDMVTPG